MRLLISAFASRSITMTFAVFCGLAACGGKAAPQPAADDRLSSDEMVGLCTKLHQEVVSCTKEFVALNFELRIQYSPEFAEMMKDPAVRKQAEEEGAAETVADAAHAHCGEFAKPAWGPAQPRSDLARLDGCYAQAACDAKMRCIKPIIEPRFAYRAKHGGPR